MAVSIQAASAVVNAAAFAFMQLTGKTQALQVGALLLPARRRPGEVPWFACSGPVRCRDAAVRPCCDAEGKPQHDLAPCMT